MPEGEFNGKWELITDNTYRMKTPSGWIVKDIYTFIFGGSNGGVSVVPWTVEDPDHKWKITK